MASNRIKKCNAMVLFSKKSKVVTFFPDLKLKKDITRSQTTNVNMTSL